MSFVNHTPFPADTWETTAHTDQHYMSAVCRIKYKFNLTDKQGIWNLIPDTDQGELFDEDIFYDDNNDEQVRYPSDYVPHKSGTDIILNGAARTSSPQQTWTCNLSVYSSTNQRLLDKSLRVWGERFWRRQAITGFWKLDTTAKATDNIPIRYRYAYGGEITITDGETTTILAREEENPIGCGILHKKHHDKITPAPQIEAFDDPIQKPYRSYTPQGFGALNRTWGQRLIYSGTYDEAWLENRHPLLPRDFDERFYHSANPDMILHDYLPKSAKIQLTNLLPGEPVQSVYVPSIDLIARFTTNSAIVDKTMHIDTVLLDIESDDWNDHRVYITWRYRHPIDEEIIQSDVYLKEE